jgi:predicted ester cyclase
MRAAANKKLALEAVARWSAGDLDGYLALYQPSCLTYGLGPEPLDLVGLREFYEQIFAAFEGTSLTPEDLLAEDDRVVIRFTFRGTHVGEFMGTPPSGADVAMTGMSLLRYEHGLIVERWNTSDFFGLLQQIGAAAAERPARPAATR